MSEVKYTTTHEWIEVRDSEGVVGITERAQLIYGDIIFVDLPPVSEEFEQDDVMCRVEAADGNSFPIRAPITGEIVAVNEALEDEPDVINRSPEGDGWVCKMSVESPMELEEMMNANEYDIFEEEDDDVDPEEALLDEVDFYDSEDDY